MNSLTRSIILSAAIITTLMLGVSTASAFSFQEFGDKISTEAQKLRRGVGLEGKDPKSANTCDAGSYKKSQDSMACVPCPVGTYNEAKASVECTACPSGKTTAKAGSASSGDCQTAPILPGK